MNTTRQLGRKARAETAHEVQHALVAGKTFISKKREIEVPSFGVHQTRFIAILMYISSIKVVMYVKCTLSNQYF